MILFDDQFSGIGRFHFSTRARLAEIGLPERHIVRCNKSPNGAVQEQIDATVESAVQFARSRLPDGVSLIHCEECGAAIPEARRKAMPGVRYCVKCQSELEKGSATVTLYNRRGNKDSQLK